jgi:hypothetical protein
MPRILTSFSDMSMFHKYGKIFNFASTLQNKVVTITITSALTLNISAFTHRVYLCVSYDSQNKKRLFILKCVNLFVFTYNVGQGVSCKVGIRFIILFR